MSAWCARSEPSALSPAAASEHSRRARSGRLSRRQSLAHKAHRDQERRLVTGLILQRQRLCEHTLSLRKITLDLCDGCAMPQGDRLRRCALYSAALKQP